MVRDAEERARSILVAAAADRDRLVAEAREEGRREGEARAAALLVRAAAERERLLAEAPREVARLSLALARKILGDALAEPEGLVALAEAALAAARGCRDVVVRANSADLAQLREAGDRLGAALGRAHVEVREDAVVVPGAVVVETERGRLDAGIEAQLEALARVLEEALP